jgi:Cu-processing system ATP-binding protein
MIDVRGVSKRFGAVCAVSDLTFDVKAGETFALIGPNGAGKTPTLKILLGLVRPDAGQVTIGPRGLAPGDPLARRDLGYVPQRVEFTPGRTVREVLGFFAALRGLGPAAVEQSLARVALTSHATRRASELSGGYTQRLSLAQALLGDPALLVLDEPTASLDPEATWEFRCLLETLQREGKTILLCSHLLAEVERIADRVLILSEGKRAALESLHDLRARQASASRLVIEPRERDRAAVALTGLGFEVGLRNAHALTVSSLDGRALDALEALRQRGFEVRSFEMDRPTLEETFLAVVRRSRHED